MPVEEEVSGEKVQRDWGAEDDEVGSFWVVNCVQELTWTGDS